MDCKKTSLLVIASIIIATLGYSSGAEEPYKGETIQIITGGSPGGGYDTYARTIARHISKHIPGEPNIVVSNMPGAGTLVAANYMYNKATPNGRALGNWNSAFVLYQALEDKKVMLDSREVAWIGAPSKASPICAIMGFTGLETLQDVLNAKKPIKMGGVRAGSPTVDLPKILNQTLGTNFEVIAGYAGTAAVRLAMARREIDGACWTWESMKATARSMLDAKGEDKLIPFLIHDHWDDPEVKHLPLIPEVIKGKENLAVYNAWAAPLQFYRPYSMPPGAPEERIAILRRAFQETLKDPDFLKDAERSKLFIHPVTAEQIQGYVGQLLSISPDTKEALGFLVRK